MSSDCYKVEVLTYLNPHLLWIEVRDSSVAKHEYVFEQIGIYGVLPLDKALDLETESFRSEKCEEWPPAAIVVIKDFLDKNSEVWFSPTYIDRTTSIFDDNIHKFGDLIIKTKDGKTRTLSKHLLKSGFAFYDVCEFHQKLNSGNLKIKLSPIIKQEVIKNLENYYMRTDKQKNNLKKSVEKHTSMPNHENVKNEVLSRTIKNNNKDFEISIDIDEESKSSEQECSETDSAKPEWNQSTLTSKLLKSKLSIRSKSWKVEDLNHAYSQVKEFSVSNSNNEKKLNQTYESSSATGNTSSEVDVIVVGKENKENALSRKLKYFQLQNVKRNIHSNPDIDKTIEEKVEQNIPVEVAKFIENTKNIIKADVSKTENKHMKKIFKTREFREPITDVQQNKVDVCKNYRGNVKSKAQNGTIAYGPPGLNPTSLKIQEIIVPANDEEQEPQKYLENYECSEKRDCMYDDVDSVVSVEITKEESLKDHFKILNNVGQAQDCLENNTWDNSPKINNNKIINKEISSLNSSEYINSDATTDTTTYSLDNDKLKFRQNAVKHNSNFSTSDTSNKESSSDISFNKESDDENIEKIIENLNLKYKDDIIIKKENISTNLVVDEVKLKNNVNPFKNIDPNISVFVDKLVSSVVMVHSKNDNRIQPVFDMNDMYFNNHVHNILRNMSIERPKMLQSIIWPVILRGYSLFMISPMGSGKTLGYLPAVCRLVNDSKSLSLESFGPVAIIVCATAQSVTEVERMAKIFTESKEKVLACYAGVDPLYITTTLLNGCDLLISTPSCLVRLMQSSEFGVSLRNLLTFVLDDCERLAEVYADEIKFFTHQIKEMLKMRANKEFKVQYIISSRTWCKFMEPLTKKVPDTVICIGAFQECALYSKTNTLVSFVKKENKVDSVFTFLKDINTSKKTVIVCQTDDEVALLEKALKRSKHVVFSCNNDMTIHDLYNLSVSWADYEEPLTGPILICCDGNLMHMNITDAHNLLHYSMPSLFSMFCKRFSVLNDHYPSIFKAVNENVKIKILLEESNSEQLPKILNFIKRCTSNVPKVLDEISSNILVEKDKTKAKNFYPICDTLLTLGYCPDIYNCQGRHTILKDYDAPKAWLPKEGTITCKILYYHSATLYSARLLSCTVDGTTTNYPQTYSNLSMKMGVYYSKDSNKKLHGTPKLGDVCATSITQNFYLRCIVLKILSKYERGNPNKVLVKLIDEERLEVTRDIYLYHLPEELKQIESRAVHVRLANIAPKDKDITFSDLARDKVKNLIEKEPDLLVQGKVALTIGNTIFVNTLEACQDLTSLNEVVVKCRLKKELLEDNHAITNPEHLIKLQKLCFESGLKQELKETLPDVSIKNLPRGTWAHLESNVISEVFFTSAISPDKFFVRLDKFQSCTNALIQDIKKYVETNPARCDSVKEGEIVLAKYPDDGAYERARIDDIKEETAKCFFVDHGDWREIPLNDLVAITEQLINRLPFQAIECRLVGIQPAGNQWTDFSTFWFIDRCDNDSGDLKYLFVKYYTKEPAEFTDGHKYSVVVIDTNTEQDIILNQLMIDLNLAQEKHSEIKYLDDPELKKPDLNRLANEKHSSDEDDNEKEPDNDNNDENCLVRSNSNILPKAPIRSVPLVNSDNESDDSDKWDVNIGDNIMDLFPGLKDLKQIKDNVPQGATVDTVKIAETSNKAKDDNKKAKIIELDSDDLTSPDDTFEFSETPTKPILNNVKGPAKSVSDMRDKEKKPGPGLNDKTNKSSEAVLNLLSDMPLTRRPKLVWRQNKTSVNVKIQIIGADVYRIDIGERTIDFSTHVYDTDIAFNIELYGLVDKDSCTHVNKGQYILIKLKKVLTKNWLTLTRDGGIKKWIVYDVDGLDASSDEETIDDSMKHIVQSMHENVDSESEDEDIDDDMGSRYRKY
ncbi:putative ATP-dependent RNA helicase TDRD12 [Bicyclus anynana]|uniref:RNA helicase n=1 Tax=Bicyclus anynana TaxID=110368 RepID=A0A6J1MU94_BICAN|nr:putative ATP-dependent RNA helicase TDRD12 [Bicyclus anynana]